jgi:hypothetical protein
LEQEPGTLQFDVLKPLNGDARAFPR